MNLEVKQKPLGISDGVQSVNNVPGVVYWHNMENGSVRIFRCTEKDSYVLEVDERYFRVRTRRVERIFETIRLMKIGENYPPANPQPPIQVLVPGQEDGDKSASDEKKKKKKKRSRAQYKYVIREKSNEMSSLCPITKSQALKIIKTQL